MMNIRRITTRAAGVLPVAAVLVLAPLGACSNLHDRLLDVQTPDIVTPQNANSIAGAQSFYTAGVGEFSRFVGGDRAGSSPLGINLTSGLLADELVAARSGTETMDNRSINPNNFPIDTWSEVSNTNVRLLRAIKLLGKYPPATGGPAQVALLHALEGYVLTMTAESYCNGIPLWDGVDDQNIVTKTMTSDQLYANAVAHFDTALNLIGTTASTTRSLALVGKARALVDQTKSGGLAAGFQQAATLVGEVPTNFVYTTTYSKLTSSVVNAIYDWAYTSANFGAVDREGGNGLDYVSAKDPRVKVDGSKTHTGQDGSLGLPLLQQYTSSDAPVQVSTGIEARMIEAEAKLAAGDVTGYLAAMNAARATIGLAPLTDPGTADARVNTLFRERGFWFYLTGHRLGDMRRLIRQYGRNSETVFPTGTYFKGGRYGTDVTLIPSFQETNNPNWQACTDRNA